LKTMWNKIPTNNQISSCLCKEMHGITVSTNNKYDQSWVFRFSELLEKKLPF
jgi:hypothetical protein